MEHLAPRRTWQHVEGHGFYVEREDGEHYLGFFLPEHADSRVSISAVVFDDLRASWAEEGDHAAP